MLEGKKNPQMLLWSAWYVSPPPQASSFIEV